KLRSDDPQLEKFLDKLRERHDPVGIADTISQAVPRQIDVVIRVFIIDLEFELLDLAAGCKLNTRVAEGSNYDPSGVDQLDPNGNGRCRLRVDGDACDDLTVRRDCR